MYNPNNRVSNTLPYDYSRCDGKEDSPTCSDCMRKLSPPRSDWQSYISALPDEEGKCDVKISVKQWEER